MNNSNELSLLWKHGVTQKNCIFNDSEFKTIISDFNLQLLGKIMSKEPYYVIKPEEFLESVSGSYDDISYRNTIFMELSEDKEAVEKIEQLLDTLTDLQKMHNNTFNDFLIKRTLLRYDKLRAYSKIMDLFLDLFQSSSQSSDFCKYIKDKYESEKIADLKNDLILIDKIISKFKSIRLGANIDPQFDVKECVILSVNSFSYGENYLSDKMKIEDTKQYKRTPVAVIKKLKSIDESMEFTHSLYKELQSLLMNELRKINAILEKHREVITSSILSYHKELKLYYGALRYIAMIQDCNQSVCYGTVTEKNIDIVDLYSVHMLEEKKTNDTITFVKNNFSAGDNECSIITGPNSGGKTVFVQSFMLMQLMFQNGFPLPAKSAGLKIYSHIYSHFPKDEDINKGTGRLGEEVERISEVMKDKESNSLLVMNEPYVSTNPVEGLEILKMTIRKLLTLNKQAIIVTHYLEIYESFKENSRVKSYIMEIKDDKRTYKIINSSPLNESYAREIAKAYGIEYETVIRQFTDRGIVK
ncbi:MAG: hypothetical protein JXQ23_01865 [Clostridia bacterium]|nr:hypothetical protein [Clostridia bacterium]